MMVEQIFGRLNLTSTEKQIVDFIEANPRIVINLPLDELSEQCYVSQASVIRFCKKLGMKGFADFKIKLASQLSTFAANGQSIHVDMPIGENADRPEIAETFYHLTAQALKTTYDSLDYQALREAARLLAKADIVHIYGRGESQILAEDFHYKLIRIGMHSTMEPQNGFEEAKCLQSSARISQAALIVSHYCNSRHIHYIVDELMSSKIPFVLITAAENAFPYDTFAAVTLRVTNAESRFKMGSFASRTAMTFLLDCLYGQIFSLQYERNRDNLNLFSRRKVERSYFYNISDKKGSYD